MMIFESLETLIGIFVICYIFIYAPTKLIKKCFSLKSLLITILIQSIIGIILNLLFSIKYKKIELFYFV